MRQTVWLEEPALQISIELIINITQHTNTQHELHTLPHMREEV